MYPLSMPCWYFCNRCTFSTFHFPLCVLTMTIFVSQVVYLASLKNPPSSNFLVCSFVALLFSSPNFSLLWNGSSVDGYITFAKSLEDQLSTYQSQSMQRGRCCPLGTVIWSRPWPWQRSAPTCDLGVDSNFYCYGFPSGCTRNSSLFFTLNQP